MKSRKPEVFRNTRSQKTISDIDKLIVAVHYSQHEEAKGLLKIDTNVLLKFYKTPEDKSALAYALMLLGGDLFVEKHEIKEGALAFWKAYQIDPENETVEKKLRRHIAYPKSPEEIERAIQGVIHRCERERIRRQK